MKNKIKKILILLFIVICFVGVVYYFYKVFIWNKSLNDNSTLKSEIDELVIMEDDEESNNKFNIDFESLKKKNSDTVAYIKVNNTKIDYVVVKGKDNDYYLHHNFNKKWNVAGWVFADYHNKFDESDKNIVIYGHNMKNGSMFGTLKTILNKKWYKNKKNNIVNLVTENGEYSYQVFSIYSIDSEDYYINTKFKNNKEFDKFVKKIKSRSIYNYKVDVSGNDKILTLSSCIGTKGKRVVLHAKLIEEN